jgi:hypothetical protein
MQMFNTDNIQSLCERRRRSTVLLIQSAYTERPIPPLVEEETTLPSSDCGGWGHADTQTGRILHKPSSAK